MADLANEEQFFWTDTRLEQLQAETSWEQLHAGTSWEQMSFPTHLISASSEDCAFSEDRGPEQFADYEIPKCSNQCCATTGLSVHQWPGYESNPSWLHIEPYYTSYYELEAPSLRTNEPWSCFQTQNDLWMDDPFKMNTNYPFIRPPIQEPLRLSVDHEEVMTAHDTATTSSPTQVDLLRRSEHAIKGSEHLIKRSEHVIKTEKARRAEIQVPTEKERSRKGLPLLFELGQSYEEVMTGHDTGTEANPISLDLARKLGYRINTDDASRAKFQLPTGKVIESIGSVTAKVQFAQGEKSGSSPIVCHFNVFPHLALPALIGMAFLKATKTLTKYRSRLTTLPGRWKRSLRLCALGNAENQVTCFIEGRKVRATADTGAEIALISGRYAKRYGLLHEYSREELELADGSLEYTCGFGDVSLAFRREGTGRKKHGTAKTVRFHVLEHLKLDVILDEHIIEDFNIFKHGLNHALASASNLLPSLGPIAHLRTVEQAIIQTKDKIKAWFSSLRSFRPNDNIAEPTQAGANETVLRELQKKIADLDDLEIQRRTALRKKKSCSISEAGNAARLRTEYEDTRKAILEQRQALLDASTPLETAD